VYLVNVDRGEHRLATVLVYLTDVEKGGETVSPSAEVRSSAFFFLIVYMLVLFHFARTSAFMVLENLV
jgi:prolyl 4-hydroxylase